MRMWKPNTFATLKKYPIVTATDNICFLQLSLSLAGATQSKMKVGAWDGLVSQTPRYIPPHKRLNYPPTIPKVTSKRTNRLTAHEDGDTSPATNSTDQIVQKRSSSLDPLITVCQIGTLKPRRGTRMEIETRRGNPSIPSSRLAFNNSNMPVYTMGFEVEVVIMHSTVSSAAEAAGRPQVLDNLMERDVYNYIRHKIIDLGLDANIHIPGPRGKSLDYNGWNITADNSIETNTSSMEYSPKTRRMLRVGVELISPVFVFHDPLWTSLVVRVFDSLNDMHWKPNRSTGLHVHGVGSQGHYESSKAWQNTCWHLKVSTQ
jgi:Putative amidoligase enzyme